MKPEGSEETDSIETRLILDEIVGGIQTQIVADGRTQGNASHLYTIDVRKPGDDLAMAYRAYVQFQQGPIQDAGINGITNEALLWLVRDRLEGFQDGPYACTENQNALAHVCMALSELNIRTEKRVDRGVEGTHEK